MNCVYESETLNPLSENRHLIDALGLNCYIHGNIHKFSVNDAFQKAIL